MRTSILFLALCACLFAFAIPAPAQTQTTDPVGFTTTTLLANSDTLISIPFLRPAEFTGAIQSVASNVITVAGTPGWTANQFVYVAGSQPKTYFVLIGGGGTSNPKEGHTYRITANGTNTLTVDISADDLAGITANTQLLVVPYWTPASIFPASDADVSFTPTTLTSSYKTQILIPGANPNISVPTYFFSNNVNGTTNNVGWRHVGDIMTNHGDDPLLSNSYFIVRNQNGAPTLPLKAIGAVLTKKLATPLRMFASGPRDNFVCMVRPVDVTLNQTGLGPGNGFAGKDLLLLFDNSVAGFNKSPRASYYYYMGPPGLSGWKLVGDGFVDHGNDVIPGGSAILIRKGQTINSVTGTVFWVNSPTY